MRVAASRDLPGIPAGTQGRVLEESGTAFHIQWDIGGVDLVARRHLDFLDGSPTLATGSTGGLTTDDLVGSDAEEALTALATRHVQELVVEAQEVVSQVAPGLSAEESDLIVGASLRRTVGSVLADLTNPDFDFGYTGEIEDDSDLGIW